MWEDRNIRGHEKKLKKTTCKRDIKKYSFLYRSIEKHKKKDIKKIVRIQRVAIKMAPSLKDLLYEKKKNLS